MCLDTNVHLVLVCVPTSSHASFKMHYEDMNANGGTCILDCSRLRVHHIKMIYKSVACAEHCASAHTPRTCTPGHHSIICSQREFQMQPAVNRQFLPLPRCVFVCVCVYKTERGGQTGIIRVRKIKAVAARPSHRLNSMER